MTQLAARMALVVVAVLALAWVGNAIHNVRLEDDAEAVLQAARAGNASEAAIKHASDLLQESKRLNPDQSPTLTQGQLEYAKGNDAGAALLAGSVTVKEPDNLQAWFLVWAASPDRATKRRALDQLRRLNAWTDVSFGLRDCLDCPLKKSAP